MQTGNGVEVQGPDEFVGNPVMANRYGRIYGRFEKSVLSFKVAGHEVPDMAWRPLFRKSHEESPTIRSVDQGRNFFPCHG